MRLLCNYQVSNAAAFCCSGGSGSLPGISKGNYCHESLEVWNSSCIDHGMLPQVDLKVLKYGLVKRLTSE